MCPCRWCSSSLSYIVNTGSEYGGRRSNAPSNDCPSAENLNRGQSTSDSTNAQSEMKMAGRPMDLMYSSTFALSARTNQ